MYKINVTATFPGAHRLDGYTGACKNLHGHNWKVRVQLATEITDELGMAIDFGIVKKYLKDLIDNFDHQYLNELPWFEKQNPTSENIARVIYEEMQKLLTNDIIHVNEVEIWESETTSIVYSR
jgi:6-pyruvoyltetrahydropterin/6-carboxytetrahydropterin synthase